MEEKEKKIRCSYYYPRTNTVKGLVQKTRQNESAKNKAAGYVRTYVCV